MYFWLKGSVSPGHPDVLSSDALKPIEAFSSVGAQKLQVKLVWLASLPPETPASKHVSVFCLDTQDQGTVYCDLATSEQLAEPY